MNKQQIEDALRLLLGGGGPVVILLGIFGVEEAKAQPILAIAVALIPTIASILWGLFNRTDRNLIAAAAQVEGVTKIKVDPTPGAASPGAVAAAADDNLPNVKAQN